MFRSDGFIHRYIRVAAVVAVVCAPLLGTAYFRTADGAQEKGAAVFTGWVDLVETIASPLVDFASAGTVYGFYSLVFAVIFPAVVLTALRVRSSRQNKTRPEKVGWVIALAGYGLFLIGGALAAPTILVAGTDDPLVNVFFVAIMFPGMALSLIGSTVLGISFVRSGFEARASAWLLALAIPLFMVGSIVLGHNSMGLIPLFLAWASAAGSPSTVPQDHRAPVSGYAS